MPDTRTEEYVSRFQVKVEAGRVNVMAHHVRKACRGMRLVRPLIQRKAHIAINAKHRATNRTRVGDKLRANLLQPRSEIHDESDDWFAHVAFVARPILLEPFAPVVAFQFLEELKQVGLEV